MLESENSLLDRLQKTMFDITLQEGVDERLKRLAKAGLIEDGEYALFIKMLQDLEEDKPLNPKMRMMVIRLFDKLLGLITKDSQVYQKILKKVKEENENRSRRHKEIFETTHTIVNHKGGLYYIDENEELKPYNEQAIKTFCEENGYK